MIIVPAIDIIDGKLVRLTEGDYNQKTDYGLDAVDMAQSFEDSGFSHLHLVDLDGAKDRSVKNLRILERIASKTNLHIDFSGGINAISDARSVFHAGAQQICIGTLAIKSETTLLEMAEIWTPEKIILGSDVKHGFVYINGWKTKTDVRIGEYIEKFKRYGFQEFMSTNILLDGKLQGVDIGFYTDLMEEHKDVSFIASGGVSSIEDIEELKRAKVAKVIVGKAIYENKIDLRDLIEA